MPPEATPNLLGEYPTKTDPHTGVQVFDAQAAAKRIEIEAALQRGETPKLDPVDKPSKLEDLSGKPITGTESYVGFLTKTKQTDSEKAREEFSSTRAEKEAAQKAIEQKPAA